MSQPRLESVWCYPVKSMRGEELEGALVTAAGLLGDRAFALVNEQNKVGTAKKVASLLQFEARFLESPVAGDAVRRVAITLPDGATIASDDAHAGEALSTALNRKVALAAKAPPGLLLEFAAGTLGGKYGETTEMPVAGGAPEGTFFDFAVVHLVTTSTLNRLHAAYPEGHFDVRRFRPNLLIETAEPGFVENAWIGRTLAVGDEVLLRVTIPCPRCVMPTLPQGDLPHDPRILRTAVEQNTLDLGEFGALPCVGVYANVVKPGMIRRGDAVRVA